MKRIIEKPEIAEWLKILGSASHDSENSKQYRKIMALVAKPRRSRIEVNLAKLGKAAKKANNMIVPGKVLGSGEAGAKFSVSAIEFSSSARSKLENAGCSILGLREMLGRKDVKVVV